MKCDPCAGRAQPPGPENDASEQVRRHDQSVSGGDYDCVVASRERQTSSTFASKTIGEHFGRGAGAVLCFVAAFALFRGDFSFWKIPVVVACLGLAMFLLRGCPMCWTIGFIETIHNSLSRRSGATGSRPR